MSIQHDAKGYVIIGEAALSLALKEQNIEVNSLINELRSMAKSSVSDERRYSIFESINWLVNVKFTGKDVESVPYIKTITSLNDE